MRSKEALPSVPTRSWRERIADSSLVVFGQAARVPREEGERRENALGGVTRFEHPRNPAEFQILRDESLGLRRLGNPIGGDANRFHVQHVPARARRQEQRRRIRDIHPAILPAEDPNGFVDSHHVSASHRLPESQHDLQAKERQKAQERREEKGVLKR